MIGSLRVRFDSLDPSSREVGLSSPDDRPSDALPTGLVGHNPVAYCLLGLTQIWGWGNDT